MPEDQIAQLKKKAVDPKSKSWKEALLLPLFVGIVVAVVAFILPKVFNQGAEITITKESASPYLPNDHTGVTIKLSINGQLSDQAFSYRVTVENTGSTTIHSMPIRFVFGATDANFKILSDSKETTPKVEFGKITKESPDNAELRYVIDLFNPGDRIVTNFLTNENPPLDVYSRGEGLKIKVQSDADSNKAKDLRQVFDLIPLVAGFVGAISAAVGFWFSARRNKIGMPIDILDAPTGTYSVPEYASGEFEIEFKNEAYKFGFIEFGTKFRIIPNIYVSESGAGNWLFVKVDEKSEAKFKWAARLLDFSTTSYKTKVQWYAVVT